MANLTLGNKTVVTQAGSAEPVIADNVKFPAGMVVKVDRIDIDPLLDKISEKGFGSLTEEEKEALQRYSKEMGNHSKE